MYKYVTLRSRLRSIMDLKRTRTVCYMPLNKKNCHGCLYLYSSLCKYEPISAKLDHNLYNHKMLDKFDYGSNQTRPTGSCALELGKIEDIEILCTLASTNIHESAPNWSE